VPTKSGHFVGLALLVLTSCGGTTSGGDVPEPWNVGGQAVATGYAAGPAMPGSTGKQVGLLGDARLYSDAAALFPALRASDYTSITFSTLRVASNGDLLLNDAPLYTSEQYVGDEAWPRLVASLKQSPSNVRRLEILLGPVAGADLTRASRSFRSLKSLLPDIDAVALDDDSIEDVESSVAFAAMLGTLGFKLSFVPSTRFPGRWGDFSKHLSVVQPGRADRLLLDLSPNGTENDVANWSAWFSELSMEPGWPSRHGAGCNLGNAPGVITSKAFFMRDKVAGAWVRLLDETPICSVEYTPTAYARAIKDAWTFQP